MNLLWYNKTIGGFIMAKKGQKFKKYSSELKEEILKKYFDEYVPLTTLSKEYNISSKTISNWTYKIRNGKDVLTDHRKENSGRPKKEVGDINYKERYEILKKYQAFLKAQRERK